VRNLPQLPAALLATYALPSLSLNYHNSNSSYLDPQHRPPSSHQQAIIQHSLNSSAPDSLLSPQRPRFQNHFLKNLQLQFPRQMSAPSPHQLEDPNRLRVRILSLSLSLSLSHSESLSESLSMLTSVSIDSQQEQERSQRLLYQCQTLLPLWHQCRS